MRIGAIKKRRDGKFAVTLTFERDLKNLHKIMTQEQIDLLIEKLETENFEREVDIKRPLPLT